MRTWDDVRTWDDMRTWDGKRRGKLRSILSATDVYAEQSFMIVPRTGFDMVWLGDSKDAHLSYDPGQLRVEDMHFEHGERVAQEYLSTRYCPSS